MRYKICCLDLDGTLLNSQGEISKRTVDAVLKSGMEILLVSGRHYSDIIDIARKLEMDDENILICSDGLYISDCAGNAAVIGEYLSAKDICILAKAAGFTKALVVTSTGDVFITNNILEYLKKRLVNILHKRSLKVVLGFKKISEDLKIEKIVVNGCRELEKYSDEYRIQKLKEGRYEVLSKGVSKFNALMILQNSWKVDFEYLLYFGDDQNDLECFTNLKHCVAMGNATEEIKKNAMYITKSNDQDGVAYALETINQWALG